MIDSELKIFKGGLLIVLLCFRDVLSFLYLKLYACRNNISDYNYTNVI